MSKFKGRSEHTVRIPSKPISEGYKILALCDAGYTLNWLFTSCIESVSELRKDDNLTTTGSACAQLCNALITTRHRRHTVFMDNAFTTVYYEIFGNRILVDAALHVQMHPVGRRISL